MRKFLLFACISLLFASEDQIIQNYPQKYLDLNEDQKKLLNESFHQQSQKQDQNQKNEKAPKSIKGSTKLGNQDNSVANPIDDPYRGFKKHQVIEEGKKDLSFQNHWIYGTAVITTTFLDGSIKRSYGILLRDGMFVTSANMVYDGSVYARNSYAMMQDDSSLPFICVARLSVKALDLQKGLAILETLSYTDMYCNDREKSFYHDRIYSRYWVDVFNTPKNTQQALVYSPYITELNSFATEKNVALEGLEQLAKKESNDFEGYKYAYGKGFYTQGGKLLGIVGASNDNVPNFIQTKEISSFLCELKDRKILKNPFLEILCPSLQKENQEAFKEN